MLKIASKTIWSSVSYAIFCTTFDFWASGIFSEARKNVFEYFKLVCEKKGSVCCLLPTPNYNLIISNCPGGLSTNVESQNLNRKDWSFRVSINGRALSNKKLPFLDLRVHFFNSDTMYL